MRKFVVGIAGIVMTLGLLAFAIGRVVLGVAGSPEAVSGFVQQVTELPEVRAELVDEITTQFADDPIIAEYADEATVRSAVESVLDSEQFAQFTDSAGSAAYRVFFEGEQSAEIDVAQLAEIALDQLADITESSDIADLAGEFGIDPITIERTEDDSDLSSIVDSVRFWSNIGLGLAAVAAVVMLVVSPVGFLRRLLPVGIAIGASGALLIGVSRVASLLPLDDADRSDMIRSIADALLGRAAGPGFIMLVIGVVLIGVGMATRFIPERRR